ncbi:ABC transporter permease [Paenibacillus sp. J2TS4]|uniref:ABC transporter permease n=1 Tax=Paenibacillus sp. J2TS4 TaxID=2807194 RepID=UPI001B269013|nr:ABC transporter permease [Paenibacillus sp. J2TS4]GIP36172.1 hypothetical protein J2TS4_53820 [Paenibacillus sp. J2TS4]
MNLLSLIKNENMKIYRRVRTWIFIGLLVGTVITIFLLSRATEANLDWQKQLHSTNQYLQSELADPTVSDFEKQELRNELAINEYRLEHNYPPMDEATLWGTVEGYTLLIPLITLFTVIIAADSVAREYSWGTMKLLLVRPVTRSRILLAKYLSALMFALIMLALLFISSMLIGGIQFGFGGAVPPHLSVVDGVVRESSTLLYLLQVYGLKSVHLLMIVTFAFMISTLFKSGSLATALSIILMFTGNAIVLFFSKYSWVKYLLFTHTNLIPYTQGGAPMEGLTLGFSLAILALYYVLFISLAWLVFNKRDVSG